MCYFSIKPDFVHKSKSDLPFQLNPDRSLFYIFVLHVCVHYENTPMQHSAIFRGCKNDNFQSNVLDYFLTFVENIDCWYMYTLESP